MISYTIFHGYTRIVLGIVVAIVLIWILIRFNSRRNPSESSLDVLKGRFERGEITEEDYEEAKRRQGK